MLKLQCTVEILNRLAESVGQNGRIRAVKGVVSLKKLLDGSLFISVSTNKNLVAHQFSVNSISSVRKQFLGDGKLTLVIDDPSINLMLRDANVQELEKLVDEITKSKRVNCCVSTNVDKTAIPLKSSTDRGVGHAESNLSESTKTAKKTPAPPKKIEASNIKRALKTNAYALKIKRKSDYPINGFDPTVKEVVMNEIMLRKVDNRLVRLKNLSILNLSNNKLQSIDVLISLESKLNTLILDMNRIEDVSDDLFTAESLSCLEHLSLNDNQLKILPRSVVKLRRLKHLSVARNKLTVLPYNLHFLKNLISLAVDGNSLRFLPHPLTSMGLNSLDISSNDLSHKHDASPDCKARNTLPSLFELTANFVATHNYKSQTQPAKILQVFPDQIPRIACELVDSCKMCLKCQKMTCRYNLRNQRTRSCALSIISDVRGLLPTKVVLCEKCSLPPLIG